MISKILREVATRKVLQHMRRWQRGPSPAFVVSTVAESDDDIHAVLLEPRNLFPGGIPLVTYTSSVLSTRFSFTETITPEFLNLNTSGRFLGHFLKYFRRDVWLWKSFRSEGDTQNETE